MPAKDIDVFQWAGGLPGRLTGGPPEGAAQAALQGLPAGEAVEDLGKRHFALALNRDVHARLVQTFIAEHGGMPATPDDGEIGTGRLDDSRNADRVPDRRPREHRDAKTHGAFQRTHHTAGRIVFQPPVDDHRLIPVAIEMRADRQQRQRHRVELGHRIVEHDLRRHLRTSSRR